MFFGFDAFFLVKGHETVAVHAVFETVELIYDDSDEQVENEDISNDYERNKIQTHQWMMVYLRLHPNTYRINSSIHHIQPSFSRDNFKQNLE
mgnify:CR=1 FL=1